MDDREFSSLVCYLDYDHHELPAAQPTQAAFCKICTAFITALSTNANENETNPKALRNGKKLKFILNKKGWIYKTTGNVAETAAKGLSSLHRYVRSSQSRGQRKVDGVGRVVFSRV